MVNHIHIYILDLIQNATNTMEDTYYCSASKKHNVLHWYHYK